MTIYVHPIYRPVPHALRGPETAIISTVAKHSGLSPFVIGPCELYRRLTAKNMENAWQYSKVYKDQWDEEDQIPTREWWAWAKSGWLNKNAVRYPRGRGAVPVGSWWDGQLLGYIAARKTIYGPLYAEAVQKTEDWTQLCARHDKYQNLVLLDYDAYDHYALNMSLTDVLNNPKKKMGHAFVLAMLLEEDKALHQMDLR